MLTATQRDMIQERKGMNETTDTKTIDLKRKKYIDFTLRNFVKKQLDSVAGVSEVLDVLPWDQTRSMIDAEHVIGVLQMLEKISSICLAPIEFDKNGNARAVYKFQLVQTLQEPINGKNQKIINMKVLFPAEPWEIKFAEKLGTDEFRPYMRVLTNLFENEFSMIRFDIEDETYAQWLSDLANRRGQPFKIETGTSGLFGAALIEKDVLEDLQIETKK
jgi:hypothetical protein